MRNVNPNCRSCKGTGKKYSLKAQALVRCEVCSPYARMRRNARNAALSRIRETMKLRRGRLDRCEEVELERVVLSASIALSAGASRRDVGEASGCSRFDLERAMFGQLFLWPLDRVEEAGRRA